jgi:hypothetical protein
MSGLHNKAGKFCKLIIGWSILDACWISVRPFPIFCPLARWGGQPFRFHLYLPIGPPQQKDREARRGCYMLLSLSPLFVLVNHACGDLSCLSFCWDHPLNPEPTFLGSLCSAAQEPWWINTEEYHSKKASVPSTVSFCNRKREWEFWSEVSRYVVPFLRCFQHLPTVEFTLHDIVFPTALGRLHKRQFTSGWSRKWANELQTVCWSLLQILSSTDIYSSSIEMPPRNPGLA